VGNSWILPEGHLILPKIGWQQWQSCIHHLRIRQGRRGSLRLRVEGQDLMTLASSISIIVFSPRRRRFQRRRRGNRATATASLLSSELRRRSRLRLRLTFLIVVHFQRRSSGRTTDAADLGGLVGRHLPPIIGSLIWP
jgi:hypothetical protein